MSEITLTPNLGLYFFNYMMHGWTRKRHRYAQIATTCNHHGPRPWPCPPKRQRKDWTPIATLPRYTHRSAKAHAERTQHIPFALFSPAVPLPYVPRNITDHILCTASEPQNHDSRHRGARISCCGRVRYPTSSGCTSTLWLTQWPLPLPGPRLSS